MIERLYDQPELASDMLAAVQECLKSDKNDGNSFRAAYELFSEIVKAQPTLAPDILTTVQKSLKSENNSISYVAAYELFREIVKTQPISRMLKV